MKHRLFIAFATSEEVKKTLEKVQNELKKANKKAQISWTKPQGFHVTIQFLGEVEEEMISKIQSILKQISLKQQKFDYWINNLDAFPNVSHPRILTIRVREEHRQGSAIHNELVKELSKIDNGIKGNKTKFDNKPWKPHITIGRNKSNARIMGLDTVKLEKIIWEIDRMNLIKSELTSAGPIYTVLDTYILQNN